MHSDDYRHSEDYAGKRVAIIGAGESGSDIANEISKHAEKVFVCAYICVCMCVGKIRVVVVGSHDSRNVLLDGAAPCVVMMMIRPVNVIIILLLLLPLLPSLLAQYLQSNKDGTNFLLYRCVLSAVASMVTLSPGCKATAASPTLTPTGTYS